MSNLRKLIATAVLGSDLTDNPIEETALDRVRAFAFADRLGGLLWRVKWMNDHRVYEPARVMLAHRMIRGREPMGILLRIAGCVLHEWLDDLCPACQGRGYSVVEGTPHARDACVACDATGIKRHSDASRIASVKLTESSYPKWEPRFAAAHALITAADRKAWLDVANQLELITGKAGVREKVLGLKENSRRIRTSDHPAHKHNEMRDPVIGSVPGA